MITIKIDSAIELKQLTPEDALALFELVDSNRPYLAEWMPWVDGTRSVLDSQNFINKETERYINGKAMACGIWYKGKLCGTCGFVKIDYDHLGVEIGYWLAESHQGKGIVTRACQGLINFGFQTFRILRVEIRCLSGNLKSQVIPEKLGFKREGILRQAEIRHDGIPFDLVIYGLLRSEWHNQIWRKLKEDEN